jgi:two-component system, LuxR family, sensor kinase FixL
MPTHDDGEAASRWQAVIESAVDGIIVIDSRGAIEAFNPAAERLFGYREADVVGQNVRLLMPPRYRDEHDHYLQTYISTGKARIIGTGREVTALRKDGTTFPIHLSVGQIVLRGEPKFTGIIHDLSARVVLEEQLREQAALAHLGEMAAVVAHEVRNPLAAVRAGVQTLGRRLPDDPQAQAVVQQIVGRVDALSELMRQLLLFAKPPAPHSVPVHMESLISSTVEFLKGDGALKDVSVDVQGTVPPIAADPDLLKIVFLNVFVNSGQAMQGRGRIRVNLESSDHTCRITVRDTGPGLAPHAKEKIFTPFFTTKAKGTGLGLATTKRLVEAHGGTIVIESPQGGGAEVSIALPSRLIG